MLFALFYLSGVYHLYIIMVCSFVFSFLFFFGHGVWSGDCCLSFLSILFDFISLCLFDC